MGKPLVKVLRVTPDNQYIGLVILISSFLLGSLLGFQLVVSSQATSSGLGDYLHSFLITAQEEGLTSPPLWQALLSTLQLPLLTLFMGFTPLGVIGIPVLFSLRGCFLSIAIGLFIQLYGTVGGLLAFASFGLGNTIALPVLFLWGVQGFLTAQDLAGGFFGHTRPPFSFGRAYFLRLGGCGVGLAVSVFLDYAVVPPLVERMALLF